MKTKTHLVISSVVLFLISGMVRSYGVDGSWTSTATGVWSAPGNWLGGNIADGAGSTAYFTNDITSDVAIHLDSPRTNGSLTFGDGDTSTPANWILDTNAAATITLSGSSPTITVNALGAGNLVNISAIIRGTNLVETGPGLLVPSGANSFTNMTINGGTVVWNTPNGNGSLGAGTTNNVITLTNGATLIRSNTANNLQFSVNVKGTDTINCSSPAANAGNLNGLFTGDGTLNLILGAPNVSTNTLTMGGNIAWNSNIWANFTGTVILSGGGNLRFDVNNATTLTFGSKFATFDLGSANNTMNERGSGTTAKHTTFAGALKGGFATVISLNSKAGDTNTLQVGDNGQSTTFNGSIRNPGGSPNPWTALVKSGAGVLTLGGTNLYSGATVIQNGTLTLAATGSISNSPSINVVSNGVFDVSAYSLWTPSTGQTLAGTGFVAGNVSMVGGVLNPGNGTNFGRLTFSNNLTLPGITMNVEIGFGTNDSVAVKGNLDLSGGITTINLTSPPGFSLIPNGTNVLFQWDGTLTGDLSNLQLAYAVQSASAGIVLSTNLAAKQILLTITNNVGNKVAWQGNAGNNVWDHSTANWLNGISTVLFTNLDDVTFDDAGVASVPVNITENVTPASVVVSNNNNAYTFSGGGQITGVTGLTKNGTNSLTILQDNSLSGVVAINAGSVIVGGGSGSGSLGSASVVNNGALVFNRDTIVTVTSQIQGSGTLVQNSTNGTLVVTSDNNAGNVWVKAGTLQIGSGNSGDFHGSFLGTITNSATLTYLYDSSVSIPNMLAGNGVVNYNEVSGSRAYTFPVTITNAGFSGTMNIAAGVSVHANTGNMGYQFGNGAQVNVASGGQAWLDSLDTNAMTTNYNSSFTVQGPGWFGDGLPIGHVTGDAVGLGALRLFNCTLTGNINLLGDTRIGSSSAGGTIRGHISDGGNNYQLEIVTSSANLDNAQTLSPDGGPNSFGRLLITSGTLTLGTNNAITNVVTMAAYGRMRLNGNNITIAELSSTAPVGVTNCVIYNFNTTNAATLSVGTDDNSTAFDGIFADGAGSPLNLTKVGAGTFALSGDSTNTGAVTVNSGTLTLQIGAGGSGSFSNATLFAVSSGATVDVNSRGDQTLTLRSGQTLKGSGTVSGNVTNNSGSTINPGDKIGTLNVSGNVTLAGTLLLELNRTNTPGNCDHLTASGSITYGGTLAVSNVGPTLQVGDFFQLFPGGTTGFAAKNLQTNDVLNNVKYTWTDTINSNGRITVATVSSGVNQNPTNITTKVSGSTLSLTWPGDHLGWRLLTNSVSLTSTGSWFQYPTNNGSADVTNVNVTIDPSKTNVFFRLIYP